MARKPGRRDTLIEHLARGGTAKAAARSSGYSVRQVFRLLADAAFAREVTEARTKLSERSAALLTASSAAAVHTLRKLLKGESEQVRLGAARAILELSHKLVDTAKLLERVEILEQRVVAAAPPRLMHDGGRYAQSN